MILLYNTKNEDMSYNPNVTVTYLDDNRQIQQLFIPLSLTSYELRNNYDTDYEDDNDVYFDYYAMNDDGVDLSEEHKEYVKNVLNDYHHLIEHPSEANLRGFIDDYDDTIGYRQHSEELLEGVNTKVFKDDLWQQLLAIQLSETNGDTKSANLFLKRLQDNVSPFVREQLQRFLHTTLATNGHMLHIDEDGSLIAYKAVIRADSNETDHDYLSINSGTSTSDGIEYKQAKIPQSDGSIVEMPRNKVEANPYSACSFGLHAGTYNYAKSFGRFRDDGQRSEKNALIAVKINPEDIVSVPYDSSAQKIRCSMYEVLYEVEVNPQLVPSSKYKDELPRRMDDAENEEVETKTYRIGK